MIRPLVSCVVILFVLSLLGCKGREEPAQPSNPVEALPPDSTEGAVRPVTPEQAAEPEPAAAVEAEPAEQAAATEPARTSAPRDLGEELRTAVGSPADCLQDYRPSSPTTIRINISAVVRSTGMIIEPSATGRGLSANDRRCVEQRIGDVTLAPLGGEASEPVTTYLDIQYQPPEVEEYDVEWPSPKLKDVVEPLPKKKPIAPSGVPIEGPAADPIEGPRGVPIEGSRGVPIEGPKPKPIEGY
ncbi:MAG: hypothetical protein OEM15_15675 [Myxococcales bacterium]|nr:hypothetical protein [Myxococcales bacterium]MDH3486131.1 hypothetical protein [Myxococcales bacterium]